MTAGLHARVEVRLGTLDLSIALEVPSGQTVAVLGPNGAGKTTLLRALAGLAPLSGGRVVLDGEVLDDVAAGRHVPAERRPVGLVFQDHVLFPHLDVVENIAFGLRSRGLRRAVARQAATDWLERVGLAGRGGDRPEALSGGEAQRVALARALAFEPRLILLDEPTAALDAGVRPAIRRELRRHLAAHAGSRLLVTHDPLEALALADRLVVVEGGRVVQQGTGAEITSRPRSRYVADLVGVNLLRGRAARDHVDLDGGGVLAVPDAGAGDVFAVVHPRAVALHRDRPSGTPRNVWRGTVAGVDDEGDRMRVVVGGEVGLVAEVTAAAARELGLAEGAPVWAAVKATEVAVYPA